MSLENSVVHVVDDDAAVRRSLAFLLGSHGLLVRVYESGSEFLSKLHPADSGCVITDVRMPGMDGLELLRRLVDSEPLLPVIIVTGHADIRMAIQAIRLGAYEFLEKPFNEDLLLNTVRLALTEGLNKPIRSVDAASRIEQFTQRERQVFEYLVTGNSNKAIAIQLGISPRTVEIHRANVMSKARARSLSDLIRMSVR